jgi:hypothetical protein
MSSETSTETRRRQDADSGLHPRHLFLLLSMIGATAAVVVVGRSHPVALILLSLTVVAAGLVGLALQGALTGFFGLRTGDAPARSERETSVLEREKAMVLRSLKELEFDRAMGKIDDADYAQLNTGLRARAIALMEALDREKAAKPSPVARAVAGACAKCGTTNDADARFCKSCGDRL